MIACPWFAALPLAALEQRGNASAAGKPHAVILDIDETVLDDSPYQARAAPDGAQFDPDAWRAWVREAQPQAIPGPRSS